MVYDAFSRALDRYITGNWGEDLFKGEAEFEDLCDRVFDKCVFAQLGQCPFSEQCDWKCSVLQAFVADEERVQHEIDCEMEEAYEKQLADDCEFLVLYENEKTKRLSFACSASSPGEAHFCQYCWTSSYNGVPVRTDY